MLNLYLITILLVAIYISSLNNRLVNILLQDYARFLIPFLNFKDSTGEVLVIFGSFLCPNNLEKVG